MTYPPPPPPGLRPKPNFLTPQEVAAALRVSKMTVYRLIKAGDLDAVRINRSYRIFDTSLSAYVARFGRSLNPDFRYREGR